MEDQEEEAITSGDSCTYKVKRSISEEAQRLLNEAKSVESQQQQQDGQSFLSFLPQFPRSFYLFNMFGKFSNIIPEETEDAVNMLSTSPVLHKGDHPISEEVKKLGLTAEPNTHTEYTAFEPKWVKTEPKPYKHGKGHNRRHSGGIIKINESGDMQLSTVGTVDDNASVEGQNSNFHVEFHLGQDDQPDILFNDMVDFSDVKCIPNKNATKSALKSTHSLERRRGRLFRPHNEEDMNSFLSINPGLQKRRGELFRGMQKSKSVSNLQQQEDINMVSNVSPTESFETKGDDAIIVSHNTSTLRRSSSTGSLQRLQSTDASLLSLAEKQKESEKENKKEEKDKAKDTPEPLKEEVLQGKQIQKKPASNFGEKLNTLGKQTMQWATTSKVKQSKKEHHMFSPTSF